MMKYCDPLVKRDFFRVLMRIGYVSWRVGSPITTIQVIRGRRLSSSNHKYEKRVNSVKLLHWHLVGEVFDTLYRHFSVAFECFASPLNCRYSHFCSAFPDIDSSFGRYILFILSQQCQFSLTSSVGSFFNFRPNSGAYEANPPFSPDFLVKMASHMRRLLKSKKPLMYLSFYNYWLEEKYHPSRRDIRYFVTIHWR